MSYDPNKIAEAVRGLRKAAGLTQAELAEKAGLAFETISRVESGREPPSLRTAMGLADAVGAPLDAVVGRGARPAGRTTRRSPDERRLLEAVRKLDPATVRHLSAIATGLAEVISARKGERHAKRSRRRP